MKALQEFFSTQPMPILLTVGVLTIVGLYVGKAMKLVRLPSILGFMLVGVVMGPSVTGVLSDQIQDSLSFLTEVALGFVAVSIGLELSFSELKKQGIGIIVIIVSESLLAFGVVTTALYLLTGNLPLSLIFGALAPASAPAGTVAVIQEFNARGPLTRALYSVVGFDDGLGIIIFGFAAAIARALLPGVHEIEGAGIGPLLLEPLKEVGLSIGIGIAVGFAYSVLARLVKNDRDILPLSFAMVLISVGVSELLNLSLILTNMIVGMVVVNAQSKTVVTRIKNELGRQMPLLFVLFFVLAGANLHVAALPALGLIGLVYFLGRSAGLMGGAFFGAVVTRATPVIRKYLGMGILSQAGVAIGLALVVNQTFPPLGPAGAYIGTTVLTTVTATSIFFELIGPILTKIGLQRAGEIEKTDRRRSGKSH